MLAIYTSPLRHGSYPMQPGEGARGDRVHVHGCQSDFFGLLLRGSVRGLLRLR